MKFACITFVPIVYHNDQRLAYGPYVKEMNLWLRHVDEILFVCPKSMDTKGQLLQAFETGKPIRHLVIPEFDIRSPLNMVKAIPQVFFIAFQVFRAMVWADHIHLRCPGNTSLVACFVQMLFPWKRKTAKYAGNWDWNSSQPWSYRLQQRILRNTLFTHNMQALVYGHWPDATKNIHPFFTATYRQSEIEHTPPRLPEGVIHFVYVGYLEENKRPLLSIEVVEALQQKGHRAVLHIFGNGSQREMLSGYIRQHHLDDAVILHGNQPAETVREAFKKSHFLLFFSKSEGWPKVVAESMFWGCVPLTTRVSCVPEMLDNGKRGSLINPDKKEIISAITNWLAHPDEYLSASEAAMQWSRQFTLEKMEEGIAALLKE